MIQCCPLQDNVDPKCGKLGIITNFNFLLQVYLGPNEVAKKLHFEIINGETIG